MSNQLLLEWVDRLSVKPYSRNSRKNEQTVAVVAESIQTYGWQQPIVVDQNMTIVAGHARWLAAGKLGLTTVPITRFTGDETAAREYRLLDNRVQEDSDWDRELLKTEIRDLDLPTGFTEGEIESLLGENRLMDIVEPTVFEVIVDVESEAQQEELYRWATEVEGRSCRVLTI